MNFQSACQSGRLDNSHEVNACATLSAIPLSAPPRWHSSSFPIGQDVWVGWRKDRGLKVIHGFKTSYASACPRPLQRVLPLAGKSEPTNQTKPALTHSTKTGGSPFDFSIDKTFEHRSLNLCCGTDFPLGQVRSRFE